MAVPSQQGNEAKWGLVSAARGSGAKNRAALTVFVQEVVLHVLAEEVLYGLADLLLLLQDVLVILSVVPLGDGWVQRHTASRHSFN